MASLLHSGLAGTELLLLGHIGLPKVSDKDVCSAAQMLSTTFCMCGERGEHVGLCHCCAIRHAHEWLQPR